MGNQQDFSGKVALVTGSTSGIGRAVARSLAASGAHVIVSGRDERRGAAVVDAIRIDGGTASFVAADLGNLETVRTLAARAKQIGDGRIDVLVNNGGVFPFGSTADTTDADMQSAYDINVKAPFVLVGALAPGMAERGNGAIVNVTTMVGQFGFAGMALYGSSKAALILLTKAWAAEFGPSGVRVNAVSPGPTRTEGTAAMGDGLVQIASQAPAGRPAAPEEIASAITFLASEAASFVHGAVLDVDGGRNAV